MINGNEQWVIIGGSGQIGHRVIEHLLQRDPSLKSIFGSSRKINQENLPDGVLAPTIIEKARAWKNRVQWFGLNLESSSENLKNDLSSIGHKLNPGKKTVLILAAAFTNVDGCELDPMNCKRINEDNTIEVLKYFHEYFQSKLVFYSTDYVFDGESGPYTETDKRNAISVYGRSKVIVEEWIEKNSPQSLILRTTGVYDYIPGSKNFVMQMLELWSQGKTVKVVSDQIANPIWAGDIARATVDLISKNAAGIYGVAGGSQLPRYEFAKLIANVFEFKNAIIEPITTASMNQKAKRPLKGGLKIEKLFKEIGWVPMDARSGLVYIKQNFLGK